MASELFDVFVIGAADVSPAGLERLASALAAKAPARAPTIAQAIVGGSLRVGQGLARAQAEALAKRLQGLGALVQLRPVAGPIDLPLTPPPVTSAGPGLDPRTASPPTSGALAGPPPTSGAFSPFADLPSSGTRRTLPGASGATAGNAQRTIGLGELASSPSLVALGEDAARAPAPAPTPRAKGRDRFAPPDEPSAGSDLELDFDPRAANRKSSLSQNAFGDGPGGLGLARTNTGMNPLVFAVDLESEGTAMHTLRCPRHGVTYDQRKSSGCRECLAPARRKAAAIEEATSERRYDDFHGDHARRALLGLALALGVGLLPASYHALHMAPSAAAKLRAEQDELARRPGTPEILQRFDEIDGQLRSSRGRAPLQTGVVWFVVAAGVMAGWYRIT